MGSSDAEREKCQASHIPTLSKNAHILWDEKSLDQWLTDPDTLVPGNNMGFHVAKPDVRRDLIRFLRQISADAVQIKPTAITRNG
jgi:cytochrome c2